MEMEEEKIAEYLKNADHMLLLPSEPPEKAICSSRAHIQKAAANLGSLYYECLNDTFPVDLDNPILKISLAFQVYIPLNEVYRALEKGKNVWIIYPSTVTYRRIASTTALTDDFVSPDHCQAGTTKQLSHLKTIHLNPYQKCA